MANRTFPVDNQRSRFAGIVMSPHVGGTIPVEIKGK